MINYNEIDKIIKQKLNSISEDIAEATESNFKYWIDKLVYINCHHKHKKTGNLLNSVEVETEVNDNKIDINVNTIWYGTEVDSYNWFGQDHKFSVRAVRDTLNDFKDIIKNGEE